MRFSKTILFLFTFILSSFVSCGGDDPAAKATETAKAYIHAIDNDRYDLATEMTLMADSAPTSYKHIIASRYRDISQELKQTHGQITQIECTKTTLTTSNSNEADVYLTLHFADKTKSSIMLQLTKQHEEWKVR